MVVGSWKWADAVFFGRWGVDAFRFWVGTGHRYMGGDGGGDGGGEAVGLEEFVEECGKGEVSGGEGPEVDGEHGEVEVREA